MRATNVIHCLKRNGTLTVFVSLLFVGLLSAFVASASALLEHRNGPAFAPYQPALDGAAAPPQGSSYAYRRTITTDHTKVPNTDQSNFPVLVSGTYSYLATVPNGGNVQHANGYDVIFTSDTGCTTKLDHEVENYNATTGAVNYWVRVPLLSHSNDTTIYLCYGNAGITTDQSNKTGVWDSNFKAVYHLGDQAANTTVTDSTVNGSNGVNAANTSGKSVSGKLGRALTYNGSSDNTATGVTQTTSFTWESWFRLTDWTTQSGSANYSTLMASNYGAGGALLMLWKDSAWLVQFAPDNVGGTTSGANSVAPGVWHHAAYTRTGNNGTYALYLNGEWKGQVASGTTSTSSTITLGARADYTPQAFNGLLDETRISSVARSADWIKTQYNNQSSPATFYSISASSSCCETATARLDPLNATGGRGENPLSRNFNWTLPLVSLPGRAGMNLGLSLSYNSLVWTRSGNYISFDDDRGFPSPGFRLGFPVIQPQYFNAEVGVNAFMLIGSDGSRTELRKVGATTFYEAADSSYLLLDTSTMILRSTDGTQFKYELKGSEYQCTEIKDRNGNYITINYTAFGRIDTVLDTLGRSIKFNYDGNGLLTSITQLWNAGATTHNWARFTYSDTTINTSFSITANGPSNNSTIKTLSKVTLADDSHHNFSYTSWGQVWKVSSFAADNHLLNYRSYNLPQTADPQTPYADCPRFTERHDWAENWNGDTNGSPASNEEAVTQFLEPVTNATWTVPHDTEPLGTTSRTGTRAKVTNPDGTAHELYFIGTAGQSSGWRRGLLSLVTTYDSGGTWQRKVLTAWTQDNTGVSYPKNPRVTETNTYDPAGNRARVRTTYQQATFSGGLSCQLPRDVYEYAADASTVLRSTRTDYHTGTAYSASDRRIIGLVTEKKVYEGDVTTTGILKGRIGFFYDNENSATSIQGTDAPTQHDNTNYPLNFVTGRANLSGVRRYEVVDGASTGQSTTTTSKFNKAGAVVYSADAANHITQISYADSFSDGNNSRGTFAYPTTLTDPDSYTATMKYNFDFGGVTYRRTPEPNTTQNQPGPEQTTTYDAFGRVERVTNEVNDAYTRFVYPNTMTRVETYTTIQHTLGEAYSVTYIDGAGRMIASATEHPGSVGGYSGKKFVYDVMGRRIKTSNPTETSASGAPSQWVTAGDDAAAGWIYTEQTYDWKSRPLVSTNQDGSTKTASYAGCGCAGGEVITLTDEGTVSVGGQKRRQQKTYSDVLGRTVKKEILNWDGTGPNGTGGTVYSAVVMTYNIFDQITLTRQYAGVEGSGTYQDTIMTYDGYGRLSTRHTPEQTANKNTVWTYNVDDTVSTVTDGRTASQTFSYNNRHLVATIAYAAPAGITVPPQVAYTYDAAGNRLSMTDGLGSKTYQYNSLSQLTQETRQLPVGSFAISYSYNLAGQLTNLTEPFGASFSYPRDKLGRLKGVTGSPFGGVTNYVNNVEYRAWDAAKSVAYGGSSSTVDFNARLQPTAFRHTTNGTGASIIRENYSYFPDGTLNTLTDLDDSGGSNPPATLRFLSRSFSYDHVGRSTGGQGTGIGTMPAVPFTQSYGYNQFGNMTARSGAYYIYASSPNTTIDTATYSNNRRSNWGYNADGQVTSTPSTATDAPRTMTYDAAGRIITSVETGQSSTVTYSATYDGDGQLIYESSNSSAGSSASYIIRSTVLNGEVLTRLDQSGNKLVTHVPAEGLLFARQTSSIVVTTHRNPLGITESGRGVYDPLGNYIPFQANGSPQPPPGSYNSGSMSGLVSSQANANSYGVGCVSDGVPTNCNSVMQQISRDQARKLFILGQATTPAMIRLIASFTAVGGEFRDPTPAPKPRPQPNNPQPNPLTPGGPFIAFNGTSEFWTNFLIAPGLQSSFEQNPAKTPAPPKKDEGQPLSVCNKNRLKPYFQGVDLDKIRIHFGFPAPVETVGEVADFFGIQRLNNSTAITIGNNIYFKSKDAYNPDTINGIAEIGHEVAHVAQMQSGRFSRTQYVREYLELRKLMFSDYDAYRFTTMEKEAFRIQEIIQKDLTNLKNWVEGDDFWSPCPIN